MVLRGWMWKGDHFSSVKALLSIMEGALGHSRSFLVWMRLVPKFAVSLLRAEEAGWWAALQRKKRSKPWGSLGE